jgi:hypothetical protein
MRVRYGAQVLAAAAVLGLAPASCGVGDGLRVEGPATPLPTPTASSPAPTATTASPTPGTSRIPRTPKVMTTETAPPLSAPRLRRVLLTDPRVSEDIRNVVRTCSWNCVQPNALLAPGYKEMPKQVVTVSTADNSVFVAYLVDDLIGSPRVVWSVDGDRMRVSVGHGPAVVVESSVYGPDDRVDDPSGTKVTVYRWNGERLVSVSEKFR